MGESRLLLAERGLDVSDKQCDLLGISSNGATAAGYWTHDATGLTGQIAGTVSGGPGFASPTFTGINSLLPVNDNSQATGVNDTGEVVGFYQEGPNSSPLFHGFTDIGGSITSFLVPGSVSRSWVRRRRLACSS